MKKLLSKVAIFTVMVIGVNAQAFACVSAGYSHTCNKDCADWGQPWKEICIYGGAKHDVSVSATQLPPIELGIEQKVV